MYCPVCHDEFRPGFARCRACDVDLVDSLDAAVPAVTGPDLQDGHGAGLDMVTGAAPAEVGRSQRPRSRRGAPEAAVNFCGFLALEDARQAKRQLKEREIESEILIKDDDDDREEFWLRVRPSDFRAVQDLLGPDETQGDEGETVLCAGCEKLVAADGEHCPQCGAPFEED